MSEKLDDDGITKIESYTIKNNIPRCMNVGDDKCESIINLYENPKAKKALFKRGIKLVKPRYKILDPPK